MRLLNLIGSNIAIMWKSFKKQHSHNVLKLVLSFSAFLLCVWVFIQWNKIPVHEHYLQVEMLATKDTGYIPVTTVCLNMNYGSMIEKELPRAKTSFNKVWFRADSKRNNYNKIPFAEYSARYFLGDLLCNEIDEKAQKKNISISSNDYSEVFYVSDTRSVDNISTSSTHNVEVDEWCAKVYGINDKLLKDIPLFSVETNRFLLLTDSTLQVNKGRERGRQYLTYAGYILATNKDKVNVASLEFPDNKNNGFPNIFKLKDITQAYYRIKVNSKTIDSLRVIADFVGATEFSGMESRPDIISMSSIEFNDFQRKPVLNEITFHASFKETENIQVVRCFFLTAFMTLMLTVCANAILGIIRGFVNPSK